MQRDLLFLVEMRDAAARAVSLVEGRSAEDVETDTMRRDALLWNFTVLGEAAARVSEDVRARHPEVPWRLASGLRNRIVHGYWSIDVDILHSTASAELPGLIGQLGRLLGQEPA